MDDLVVLSSWNDRFWAWLIDVLLMGILWYRVTIVLKIDALGISGVTSAGSNIIHLLDCIGGL